MGYPFDCISDFIFINTSLESSDVILVPGSSSPKTMFKAAELYREGLAPYILPSGGYNEKIKDYSSEWECYKAAAIEMGVPESALLKEDKARNTFENAIFSQKVLKNSGLPFKKAIIVCKAYHSRRALLTYQAIFPHDTEFFVCSVPDKNEITKENWFLKNKSISIVMGEVVKIGSYFKTEIEKMREG